MFMFHPFRWVFIFSALIYFIPAIVGRKKRNASAIFWLNFFLGWTVVGWVGALVWALMSDPVPAQVMAPQPVPQGVFCARCGRYSPPGARFCSSCGTQIAA
jgi:hypothetical protein